MIPPRPDLRPDSQLVLGKSAARRLKTSVQRVEAQFRRPSDQRRAQTPATPFLTIQPGKLLTPIGPGTLASPANTGVVQIYRDLSSTGTTLYAAETGVCTHVLGNQGFASGITVQVYWRNGVWWIAIGSGVPVIYWTRSGSLGIPAASGSWPALTGQQFTADVYVDTGGGGLGIAFTGQTINWFYKDADPGNRLIPVLMNATGGWDGIADSCTAV